jgi:small subunit ribosomal protein S23
MDTFRLKDISFAMIRTNKEVLLIHRVRGLLRSGALKEEDKPVWYDVYTAFPPKYDQY